MSKRTRISSAAALMIAVGTALAIMQANRSSVSCGSGGCCLPLTGLTALAGNVSSNAPTAPAETKPLPKLLDLGADKCIPCKMMAPILVELKMEHAGRLEVEFIDVWKNQEAGRKHKIEMIPTQIFFDAAGKELFRHSGFYSKKDILNKWKELGVDLTGSK